MYPPTSNLTWSLHTDGVIKKAYQCIYFLNNLRTLSFYKYTIESVLMGCVINWYGICSAFDCLGLQWVVNTVKSVTGLPLPSILAIFTVHCFREAGNIINGACKHGHSLSLFYLLGVSTRAWKFGNPDLNQLRPHCCSTAEPVTSFTPHSRRCCHILLLIALSRLIFYCCILTFFSNTHFLHYNHPAVLQALLCLLDLWLLYWSNILFNLWA